MSIAIAIILVTVVGLVGAVILVLAAKFMSVYEDPRIGQVTECLPGANCGGCGFAGCADYAKAVVENGEEIAAAVSINYGSFLATILDFLIIAFAVFCLIKGINSMHRKKEEEPAPEPAPEPEPSNEEKLLTEIRDLLKEK